jgi:DNA topoisomerase-1
MAKNLVIVESPAKAKTIEGFLGKDYTVKSCFGHIRDLSKEHNGVMIEKNFAPIYEVSSDKKQVVSELKKLAKEADTVWLASDEDREGEAISWHLAEVLKLDKSKTKRIVFHEITKPAIQRAIENPRDINKDLVDAQQARRVLDRIVGFELSPILWKKVRPSLSAGRVQSVAVRLIVEREREILDFKPQYSYRVVAEFTNGNDKKVFKAELPERFKTKEEAQSFLEKCKGATFNINSIETRPTKRSPAAPFTTSTLQQEASRKLGFSVSQTMRVAQKLYESGLITYMRTDSVNLSDTALEGSKREILSAYGDNFLHTRKYKTKNSGAQEAHEAIRPTYFNRHTIDGDNTDKKLYELIWKRAIASQMSDAQFEKTTVNIGISTTNETLVAQGEVLKFEGFLKVYLEGTDDEDEDEAAGTLPALKNGDILNLQELTATQRFTRPPARFTEASLVKKLEELGIGRPSTYAPTISTVQKRGYIVKEDRDGVERKFEVLSLTNGSIREETKTEITGAERKKLFPNDIGILVNDFLIEHFDEIMDYKFTATVEEEFDKIAQGMKEWTKMLDSFYKPFHRTVEHTTTESDRVTGERHLGTDPKTGKPLIVRMSRFGPVAQIGGGENDDEKPQYANLRKGQMLETITFEEAIELFKLPRVTGEYEGKEMKVQIGRFGPYILHNSKFISIPKTEDPYTITAERCIELIEAKRKADAEKLIKNFPEHEIQILKGRWGPYLAKGKENFKIPKEKQKNPQDISLEDALAIIDAAPKTPVKAAANKKATAKPAAKKSGKKATATTKKKAK